MINVELDKESAIATLNVDGELSENDFASVASVIDPYIEQSGKLKGIIINTKKFPGWDSFAALVKHIKFVKEHHKKVSHVAFVTDSVLGDLAEKIADHFVSAEIKHFDFDELDEAQSWIKNA